MPDISVFLALALGFLVGALVGARGAFRLVSAARRSRGTYSRLARFLPDTIPTRSAADILAGRVRVVLGGAVYDLPVLPRAASRRWLQSLDQRFATLAMTIEAAGNDSEQILALLVAQSDEMYDFLLSYDESNVLPSRAEADEIATDAEILQAVLEVWRAANPLAATAAEGASLTSSTSSGSPSSSPPNTAGRRATSST